MTSALIRLPHICPSCGYAKLGSPPYANLKQLPVDESLQPPYSQHFGDPSYEVCACCGFEFGNDDDAGTRPPKTFREYRNEWIADGVPWFDGSKRPADWTLEQQLTAAGMVAFKGG